MSLRPPRITDDLPVGGGAVHPRPPRPRRVPSHDGDLLCVAGNGGVHTFDSATLWSDDVSRVTTTGWSS